MFLSLVTLKFKNIEYLIDMTILHKVIISSFNPQKSEQ